MAIDRGDDEAISMIQLESLFSLLSKRSAEGFEHCRLSTLYFYPRDRAVMYDSEGRYTVGSALSVVGKTKMGSLRYLQIDACCKLFSKEKSEFIQPHNLLLPRNIRCAACVDFHIQYVGRLDNGKFFYLKKDALDARGDDAYPSHEITIADSLVFLLQHTPKEVAAAAETPEDSIQLVSGKDESFRSSWIECHAVVRGNRLEQRLSELRQSQK
eukprot:TRINITY_DN7224_c0_g1_i1.p1 TRINITY_DN7224_c0_g1~~TRINITY_DN7224_c0_g1_i1.p1  ORF type:complete len:213 (+),score=17.16 TRINITY_DN7224_c0_g1_i1:146-784(+)